MTLGTGIFLAALLLSATWLYIATRDRWRWKRIVAVLVGGTLSMAASVALGIWGYTEWQDRPYQMNELNGIRLGTTERDVRFYKGAPSSSSKDEWIYEVRDYKGDTELSYVVNFDGGTVQSVWATGQHGRVPGVFGLSSYMGTADLIQKLGEPDSMSGSKDGAVRMLYYKRFNLTFGFAADRLHAIGIRADKPAFQHKDAFVGD